MQRRLALALVLAISTTYLAGCNDFLNPARRPGAASRSQSPTVDLDGAIQALVDSVLPKGQATAAHARWDDVKRTAASGQADTLEGKAVPGKALRAQFVNLVQWVQSTTSSMTPPSGETQPHAAARLVLDMSLYVYSGPTTPAPTITPGSDAVLAIVTPGTAAVIQTPTQHAGVSFPADAVTEPTVVVVTQPATAFPDNCSGPLVTHLCQYPQFYSFNVFPDVRLQDPATVGVCHVNSGSIRNPRPGIHDRFRLAHDKPANPADYVAGSTIVDGVEILPLVFVPTLFNCTSNDTYSTRRATEPRRGASSWLDRGLQRIAQAASAVGALISPERAYAIDQGGGGLVELFSQFNVLDPVGVPDLSVGPAFGVNATSIPAGRPLTLQPFTINNVGDASAGAFTSRLYIAADSALTQSAIALGSSLPIQSVIMGASATIAALNVTIPISLPPGNYFVGIRVDDGNAVTEADETNNYVSTHITVTVAVNPARPISINDDNACVLRSAATYCWGSNFGGQLGDGSTGVRFGPVQVVGGFNFVSLAAGFEATCGLAADSTAACWGLNSFGATGNGTMTGNNPTPTPVLGGLHFQSITAGPGAFCALSGGGAAYCWGYGADGGLGDGTATNRAAPTPVATSLAFTTLGVGQMHACGITAAGAAYCWGDNVNGDVGDGTATQRNTPVAVVGGLTFASITGGNAHTCALTPSGDGYCWGLNDSGELGDGTTTQHLVPTLVAGGHKFTQIQAAHNGNGEGTTCALDVSGTIYCWGSNVWGQLGDGTLTNSLTPTPVGGAQTVTSFDLDNDGGCALAAGGQVSCWGLGAFVHPGAAHVTPAPVNGGQTFSSLTAGDGGTCALTAAGVANCWGSNLSSALGDGTFLPHFTPQPVAGAPALTSISMNTSVTCGVASGGSLYCWRGSINTSTAISLPSSEPSNLPTLVSSSATFVAVSVGGPSGNQASNQCALSVSGAAYCWGANGLGQVGDGTTITRSAPVPVAGGHMFQAVSARGAGACALDTSGSAYCWGSNTSGQLGIGSASIGPTSTPVAVSGGLTFVAVSAGPSHTCALTAAGAAYCWGSNLDGQLGTGSPNPTPTSVPTLVATNQSFAKISVASNNTCALTSAGAAWCWGFNDAGQLGDGTVLTRAVPVLVGGGTAFVDIQTGFDHTCALTAAGTVYCWGDDIVGALGDGDSAFSLVPRAVAVP